MLDSTDDMTVQITLEALFNLMTFGSDNFVNEQDENQLVVLFEEQNCLPKVEKLQKHRDHDVYTKALQILETFYDLEDAI